MEAERTVSWMAIHQNARVIDRDGADIGHVEAVLGDEEDDIFHGLALNLKGWGGHVELPADHIQRITADKIYTDLGPDEGRKLEELETDRWFEFEGRSRFLKRSRWEKDD
jgi:PRC-barrel domain protein